jgi:hypothetical protein
MRAMCCEIIMWHVQLRGTQHYYSSLCAVVMHAGFCKQQLWPLFHYVLPMSPSSAGRFNSELWQAYVKANKVCVWGGGVCCAVPGWGVCCVVLWLRWGRPMSRPTRCGGAGGALCCGLACSVVCLCWGVLVCVLGCAWVCCVVLGCAGVCAGVCLGVLCCAGACWGQLC